MKKSIFITVALFAFTSITSQLFAQDASKTAGYDLKKAVKCRISQTENGCSIVFESSPSSAATGTAKSKKGYDYYMAKSSFSVSATDNSVSEIVSPRDAASGLPTGKRQHKPISISSEVDKTSPIVAESVSGAEASAAKGSGGGSGKVNVQDISFTKRCGGKTTKISCDGGDCEIPTYDCPNGDCSLIASWSWGVSQGGSSKRCSVDFLLEIEDGVCTKMAINEKGTGGTKGTTKK